MRIYARRILTAAAAASAVFALIWIFDPQRAFQRAIDNWDDCSEFILRRAIYDIDGVDGAPIVDDEVSVLLGAVRHSIDSELMLLTSPLVPGRYRMAIDITCFQLDGTTGQLRPNSSRANADPTCFAVRVDGTVVVVPCPG